MDPVPLVTGAEGAPRSYKLMEIPPELESILSAGTDSPLLTFNGRLVDEAVLSTTNKTYAVRQVHQSNSLLLCAVEQSGDGGMYLRLHQNVADTIELVPTPPRLGRIVALLHDSEYAGEEAEMDAAFARLYTPNEVRSVIQASEEELAQGLRDEHVLVLDVLNQLDILACDAEHVPYAPVLEALQMSARAEVAEKMLCDWFCAAPRPTGVPTHVALATADIARFIGVYLLSTEKRMALLDFLARWKEALGPLADEAQLPLLTGNYLFYPPPASFTTVNAHQAGHTEPMPETLASGIAIQYFPREHLPLAPAQCLQELFMLRTQWVREEITPFIAHLLSAAPGSKKNAGLDGLLLKHGRSCKARWSRVHAAVLLRAGLLDSAGAPPATGTEECTLYQARVKY
ncbi:Ctf8p and Ctf18p associating protein [Malassezia vespertilionis]|uniref:Ctf8p and Ctf18p associating protein n=1 Tax=Malassezia vespertilionis TaxID=2020962 RepID=UPI0024B0B0C0|nr:Ctf8p and Ctf18p associating protein [Malassezia vespertilionis]WFD05893.1 Ctf8p and Ctf18p associating protein [Malassezia vespertilionis]